METITEEFYSPVRDVKVLEQRGLMGIGRRIYLHFNEGLKVVAAMPITSHQMEDHLWDSLVDKWESGILSWNYIDTFVKLATKKK